jgi:hypothetical protein
MMPSDIASIRYTAQPYIPEARYAQGGGAVGHRAVPVEPLVMATKPAHQFY